MRAGGQRQRPGGGLDSAVRGGGQADSGNVTRKWNRYQPDSLTKHATRNTCIPEFEFVYLLYLCSFLIIVVIENCPTPVDN